MTQNGKYKILTEHRLTTLESNYLALQNDVTEIKDNHLVHLEQKVDRIQWLLVTTLITVIIGLIMKLL